MIRYSLSKKSSPSTDTFYGFWVQRDDLSFALLPVVRSFARLQFLFYGRIDDPQLICDPPPPKKKPARQCPGLHVVPQNPTPCCGGERKKKKKKKKEREPQQKEARMPCWRKKATPGQRPEPSAAPQLALVYISSSATRQALGASPESSQSSGSRRSKPGPDGTPQGGVPSTSSHGSDHQKKTCRFKGRAP